MDSMNLYLSGRCPYCHTVLDYLQGEGAVHCHACERTVATSSLLLELVGVEDEIPEDDRYVV